MELQKALHIADGLLETLTPHCETINIAGSCRRRKPDVHDIEIVCLPQMKMRKALFGEDTEDGRKKEFITVVGQLGKIIKGSAADGQLVQVMLPEGISLDLFIPTRHDYYRKYALRTGSGDYAKNVIAAGWRKIGWSGCGDDGLRRTTDCIKTTGKKPIWKCVNKNGELPPVWKSEQEFFDWIKVRYVEPQLRNI